MFTIFQSLASHSYTFREVAAYVTITICMSFAAGFLIEAYTRIFKYDAAMREAKKADKWG